MSPERFVRPVLLSLALGASLGLASCDSLDSLFGSDKPRDQREAEYVERPIDAIYNDAWKKIREGEWEDAAKQAVQTASKSLRDLRIAEVVKMDLTVDDDGKVAAFRTRVALSFKYEA